MKKKIVAGISIGDCNGIGIEVILKTLKDPRILEEITPVIYGTEKALSFYMELIPDLSIELEKITSAQKPNTKKVNIVDVDIEEINISPGVATDDSGKFAFCSLKKVTEDLSKGFIDVLITAPINKKNIQCDDFQFMGHTEYLTKMSNLEESLMLMVDQKMKVGLVTNHIEIGQIKNVLSKDKILEKLKLMKSSLIMDFNIINPKIAVLGLNPHAGDQGLLGNEELEIIGPAIKKAKEENILAFGPFAADGFFGNAQYCAFDGVLAMYHDQGLIPFKTISNNHGVNYTAGLPIIRTSPDHGTGMDIAGKGSADETSFRNALFLAKDIFLHRKKERDLRSSPLVVKSAN